LKRIWDIDAVLLDVKDIHCFYGDFEAANGISIAIEEGLIAGILGANGSGKSTLMKAISGLIKPARGEIWFAGRRIDGMRADKVVALGIAHVPEHRRLFSNMSVIENLLTGASCRNDKRGIAADLESMYVRYPILGRRRAQKASSLSGGEQAQLAIARALMSRPKLLLLDEPLQGLAPLVIGAVEEMILELHRDGMTILMVEHNVHMTLGMCDRIFIIDSGKVVTQQNPRELSENEYVREAYLGE
jgi:branched-chain amino acid transport system ATP-binding protein